MTASLASSEHAQQQTGRLVDQLQINLLPSDGGRVRIERAAHSGRPRGVICSLATGRHRELLAESAPTIAAYAQRFGWGVVLSSETLGDRPPSWSKIILVKELLQEFDLVFWVDADALIVDLERDLIAEIDDAADIWFAGHPQDHDPEATVLNAGVFLARSSQFTRDLLDAIWDNEQFVDHNWWENAALLDLLGYSLDAPFRKLQRSKWDARIGSLDLAWNSVPGYCESPHPALNHHARSDHDNFGLRLQAMSDDRKSVMRRFPEAFVHVRSPSSAGVDSPPLRTHGFDGVDVGAAPTVDELLVLLNRLDADFETQRLKLLQVLDRYEDSVNETLATQRRLVAAEERADRNDQAAAEVIRLQAHITALNNTKMMRAVRPIRSVYAKLLERVRG